MAKKEELLRRIELLESLVDYQRLEIQLLWAACGKNRPAVPQLLLAQQNSAVQADRLVERLGAAPAAPEAAAAAEAPAEQAAAQAQAPEADDFGKRAYESAAPETRKDIDVLAAVEGKAPEAVAAEWAANLKPTSEPAAPAPPAIEQPAPAAPQPQPAGEPVQPAPAPVAEQPAPKVAPAPQVQPAPVYQPAPEPVQPAAAPVVAQPAAQPAPTPAPQPQAAPVFQAPQPAPAPVAEQPATVAAPAPQVQPQPAAAPAPAPSYQQVQPQPQVTQAFQPVQPAPVAASEPVQQPAAPQAAAAPQPTPQQVAPEAAAPAAPTRKFEGANLAEALKTLSSAEAGEFAAELVARHPGGADAEVEKKFIEAVVANLVEDAPEIARNINTLHTMLAQNEPQLGATFGPILRGQRFDMAANMWVVDERATEHPAIAPWRAFMGAGDYIRMQAREAAEAACRKEMGL